MTLKARASWAWSIHFVATHRDLHCRFYERVFAFFQYFRPLNLWKMKHHQGNASRPWHSLRNPLRLFHGHLLLPLLYHLWNHLLLVLQLQVLKLEQDWNLILSCRPCHLNFHSTWNIRQLRQRLDQNSSPTNFKTAIQHSNRLGSKTGSPAQKTRLAGNRDLLGRCW